MEAHGRERSNHSLSHKPIFRIVSELFWVIWLARPTTLDVSLNNNPPPQPACHMGMIQRQTYFVEIVDELAFE